METLDGKLRERVDSQRSVAGSVREQLGLESVAQAVTNRSLAGGSPATSNGTSRGSGGRKSAVQKAAPRKSRLRRVGKVGLFLHHGAWWLRWRVDGREERRRVGPDLGEAERVAAEVNAQLSRGGPTLFAFEPITVTAVVQGFLEEHEAVLRSSLATVGRYRTALAHLVEYTNAISANLAVHDVRWPEFVRFLRERQISANGHPNTPRRPLRDKGVRFILEVCRALYRFAAARRHFPPYAPNPFENLNLDRFRISDAKSIFVFDESNELRFLKACRGVEFAVQLTLAKTGLRPGELCHLLIEELDLEGGWLLVRNKPELGWSVKTRNERNVPLVPELRQLLRRHLGTRTKGLVFRRPRYPVEAGGWDRRELLKQLTDQRESFERSAGRPVERLELAKLSTRLWQAAGAFDPDQIRRSFLSIAKRASLDDATCVKSWRHTFATLLQDANVDPLLRQITLGHQPTGAGGALGMTNVYTHSRPTTHAAEIGRAVQLWPESLRLAAEWSA